jgi:hypothetical protein
MGRDAAGVDQVGGDRDVEVARCTASLFDVTHATREVEIALEGLDGDVCCNDDHGHSCSAAFEWAVRTSLRVFQMPADVAFAACVQSAEQGATRRLDTAC